MKTLITICARAGSKGLPGKNTKLLLGRPLIQYTIDIAKHVRASDVVLSTDIDLDKDKCLDVSHTIRLVRESYLCQDDTPKLDVIRGAVEEGESRIGVTYDRVIDLDVTNPCREPHDIDACLDLCTKGVDSVVSVTRSRRSPFFNMVVNKPHPQLVGAYSTLPVKECCDGITRRQDTPNVYDINANIYVYNRDWLMGDTNPLHPITPKSILYVMGDECGVDIDNEVDFGIVEGLMGRYFGIKKLKKVVTKKGIYKAGVKVKS